MSIHRAWWIWLALLWWVPCAAESTDLATRVKAAFLYKFCAYVQWPERAFEDASAPVVIAVAGSETFAAELRRTVHERQVQGRSVKVRKLESVSSPDEIHVLYVGHEDALSGNEWNGIAERPVLLVMDTASSRGGGIIEFVLDANHIKFDVSLKRAQLAGLKLSSDLLSVARRVETDGSP